MVWCHTMPCRWWQAYLKVKLDLRKSCFTQVRSHFSQPQKTLIFCITLFHENTLKLHLSATSCINTSVEVNWSLLILFSIMINVWMLAPLACGNSNNTLPTPSQQPQDESLFGIQQIKVSLKFQRGDIKGKATTGFHTGCMLISQPVLSPGSFILSNPNCPSILSVHWLRSKRLRAESEEPSSL